jgi:hypothetical protein
MKKFLIAVALFLSGFITQTCIVNASNVNILNDMIVCSNSNPDGLSSLACFHHEQQKSNVTFVLNFLNPAGVITYELMKFMAVSSDVLEDLKQCEENGSNGSI